MNYYFFAATISLAFEFLVLALIVVGYRLKRHMGFRRHGFVMLAAFVVQIINIGAVMAPSLAHARSQLTGLIGLFLPVHAALGIVTVIFAAWIIFAWRLRQSTKFCAPKKKLMRATFILWLISLFLGIILYFILF